MKYFLAFLMLCVSICASIAQSSFVDGTILAQIAAPAGGEGVAVGDFNNDGYDDFYVSYPEGSNLLYKNLGDGTFVEIGEAAGVAQSAAIDSRAAVWGDINNDGWIDLYVGNKFAPDELLLNLGNEKFEAITATANIFQLGHPKSVNMADVNADGYLDIYVSNFVGENVLYLNNGDLSFTDFTTTAGALDRGRAMGSIFFDYDKDGDLDLYLVHDGNEPNFLYQNDGTGRFTEVGVAAGVATASFGMGVDVGDVNNDGWLDIYITNLGSNFLLLNNGDGTFSDISATANIGDAGMGWGISFLDYDNDGWLDIYVSNDAQFSSFIYPNVLYHNQGDLTFEVMDYTQADIRLDRSYGAACTDFDLDGRQDILFVNKGDSEGLRLLKNEQARTAWLGLHLVGTVSNRDAVGAKIAITNAEGQTYYREVVAGQSWASQNSSIVHFGLGATSRIQALRVIWPSGEVTNFEINVINQFYTVLEDGSLYDGILYPAISTQTKSFITKTASFGLFPNPSNGIFALNFTTPMNAPFFIEVYDLLGRLIFQKKVRSTPATNIFEVSLAAAPLSTSGVWVRVFNEQFSLSKYMSIQNRTQ